MALTGYAKTVDFTTDPTKIVITVTATGEKHIIKKANVSFVEPVKIYDYATRENPTQNNIQYRYSKIVCVRVHMNDGSNVEIELQDVTNQAGWTINLAGQNQCVTDLS